ncbi:MAG: hypothetical protein QOK29_1321 [Rhodospirillaceae bacterium]|jgi:hypothetical protein|nr:hypothetical protein [Rhodospirillaceae bacterium]
MSKLLGSIAVIATLATSGAAFACMNQSVSADGQAAQTASTNGQTTVPPTDGATTTPKATEVKTGG